MGVLFDEIIKEDGLLIKLRCDNEFDNDNYQSIKQALIDAATIWKETGKVDIDDFVIMLELIEYLAGGSRFWSNEVAIKVEDAELEIMDIIRHKLC